jgi:maltose O-acetyltransferase
MKFICLILYYIFLQYLPKSSFPIGGPFFRWLRYICCRNIFEYCGRNVNIERRVYFGSGRRIKIGDNSGIGIHCVVPSDIIIGTNVMMGPNCYVLDSNHNFSRTDIPIINQGYSPRKQTIIEDDVWLGRQILFTPGRIVKRGTIIAAGCVLTKDFDAFSIVGGNPSRLIKSRK